MDQRVKVRSVRLVVFILLVGSVILFGLSNVAWAIEVQKPLAQTIVTPTSPSFGPRPGDDDDDDPTPTPGPAELTATAFVATETAFVATQTAQASITASPTPEPATQTADAIQTQTAVSGDLTATAAAAQTQTALAVLAGQGTITPTPTSVVPQALPETGGEVAGSTLQTWFWFGVMLIVTTGLVLLTRRVLRRS